jgi:hypothetical protein
MKPSKKFVLLFSFLTFANILTGFFCNTYGEQPSEITHTTIILPGIKKADSFTQFYRNFSIVGDPIVHKMSFAGNIRNRFGIVYTLPIDDLSLHKAIIVAAKEDDDDVLWEETNICANFAYRVLRSQGYHPGNIKYLSSNEQSTYANGFASSENLFDALTTWANPSENLVIYMIGHGGVQSYGENAGGYFVIGKNDFLYAAAFDDYLDTLQTQNQQLRKVILIYDSCHSGSFIGTLKPPEKKKRYIVTSASENELAAFMNNGGLSFSYQFWSKIFNGGNLLQSFNFAKNMMSAYQHSLIDLNADGNPCDYTDKELANKVVIGKGINYAINKPSITQVCDEITLKGSSSKSFWIKDVLPLNKVENIWAVIVPPNYDQLTTDDPITDKNFDIMELKDEDNDGTYEGAYHHFDDIGTYKIACYASYPYNHEGVPRTIYSNPAFITVNQLGHIVRITDITPDQHIEDQTSVEIWAENIISLENDISQVWAFIEPPDYKDHSFQTEPFQLTLNYNEDSNRYEAIYDDFLNYGKYKVKIIAQDIAGNQSLPYELFIHKSMGPDIYEPDNTKNQASVAIINDRKGQHHNFHEQTDEDWMVFYGKFDVEYTVEIDQVEENCDPKITIYKQDDTGQLISVVYKNDYTKNLGEELSWTCDKDDLYFIKINHFGDLISFEKTGYRFKLYHPYAGEGAKIKGTIYDVSSNIPVFKATIKIYDDDDIILASTLSSKKGNYIIPNLEKGTYTLTAKADHYLTTTTKITVPLESVTDTIDFDIVLTPEETIDNINLPLNRGLNLIAYPVEAADDFSSFDLFESIGNNNVDRISMYEGKWYTASFSPVFDVPVGKDFNINNTSAILIYMKGNQTLESSGNKKCTPVNFSPGLNLSGIGCPPDNLTSHELLNQLGGCNAVKKISRFDGKWISTSCLWDQPVGSDFPILHGEGYLIYMNSPKENFRPAE